MIRDLSAPNNVFISYVREDSEAVRQLQTALEDGGLTVWRDVKDLWPGDVWKQKIEAAIRNETLAFIPCFSRASVSRPSSTMFEELIWAAEVYRERNPDRPWIFPVLFDEVPPPSVDLGAGRTLGSLQWARLYADREEETSRLIHAIRRLLPTPDKPAQSPLDRAIKEVFGGTGWASVLDEFAVVPDYDFVAYRNPSDEDEPIEVSLHRIGAYRQPAEPLSSREWDNFKELVAAISPPCALVLTRRPAGLKVGDLMDHPAGLPGQIPVESPSPNVYAFTTHAGNWVTPLDDYDELVVVVDISDGPDETVIVERLRVADAILRQFIESAKK